MTLKLSFPYYEQSNELQKSVLSQIHDRLFEHFGKVSFRKLPILDELILTVLSQNTADRNRDRAYKALRKAYPTWEQVSNAPLSDLIEVLKPAGLAPQKAPRIKNIIDYARELGDIELNFLKNMPPSEAETFLLSLPGVGIKTAYCTMLFSCDMSVYPMDTHIIRIFKRLSIIPDNANVLKEHRRISSLLGDNCRKEDHLNVINLGKTTCKARKPLCSDCPISDLCSFFLQLQREED